VKTFPKPGKAKKHGKTTAEKEHLNWVASQPCMIPGCLNRSCVHHIREHGEPRDHYRTIPLCYFHHQGEEGIHFMGKHVWREKYGYEVDMLKKLMELKHGSSDTNNGMFLCQD